MVWDLEAGAAPSAPADLRQARGLGGSAPPPPACPKPREACSSGHPEPPQAQTAAG